MEVGSFASFLLALPFVGKFIYLLLCQSFADIAMSSEFQGRLKSSNSPGNFQAFRARLRLLRLLPPWTEQLLGSQSFQCETDITGLPSPLHEAILTNALVIWIYSLGSVPKNSV